MAQRKPGKIALPHRVETKVCNIYESSYDCYVGPPHDGRDPRELQVGQLGWLANPFIDGSVEENNRLFERYFIERVSSDKRFKLGVLSLYGRRLGCLCDGEDCHALAVTNWLHYHKEEWRRWFGLWTDQPR